MKIAFRNPPNIETIKKYVTPPEDAVFTYGDTLYSPLEQPILEDLLIHEEIHKRQQGGDPDAWWHLWCTDTEFRLEQEIQAYRNQYAFYVRKEKSREKRFHFARRLALALSSEMYGNIIFYSQALASIQNGIKN